MNQNIKNWVTLVTLIMLLVLIVCTSEACTDTAEATESPRFTAEYTGEGARGMHIYVITDNETGAQYLFIKDGYGGGLTVLDPAREEGEKDDT